MKREFLQEFKVGESPLPKEVIDAIMAENGRDIQKVKAGFADYEDMKAQLSRLQQDQSFAEAAKSWEEKYNQAVNDHKAQIAKMAFEKVLSEGILKAKGRNARAITALLDLDALQKSEDPAQAVADALAALKQDSRYLFEAEAAPPYAQGTGAFAGIRDTPPTTLAGALREKFERK